MDFDHNIVIVDEFDALSIELKVPNSPRPQQPEPKPPSSLTSASESERLRIRQKLNEAWLRDKVGKFPAKRHARKVAKELGVGAGIIYLPGQEKTQYEDSDQGPAFHQRRHFYYMAGANFPGCAVTYDIRADYLMLWIPYTDPKNVLWYGKTPSVQECMAACEVDDVRYIQNVSKYLCAALAPGRTLYVLNAEQAPKLETTRGVVTIDATRLRPAVERARVLKTDYEIAMIRRANAVSSGAHRAVLTRLARLSLSNEREVEAIFRGFCIAQGAKTQAYPVIAAAGTSASTLHYEANNQSLAGRQLLVLDAGAEWDCYASDITRTIPLSGKFSPEAAAVYAIVERMQAECIQHVRPGIQFASLHLHACSVAAEELLRLGIFHNAPVPELVCRGVVAAFFPHGLGHHVGLDVHDVNGDLDLLLSSTLPFTPATALPETRPAGPARVPPKRFWIGPEAVAALCRGGCPMHLSASHPPPVVETDDGERQRLRKNMVVTVEPGIYFCREYIYSYFLDRPSYAKYFNKEVLDKYWDVGGVRIEDDILVTENGYENLTTAPKGEEMLKIMSGCAI